MFGFGGVGLSFVHQFWASLYAFVGCLGLSFVYWFWASSVCGFFANFVFLFLCWQMIHLELSGVVLLGVGAHLFVGIAGLAR